MKKILLCVVLGILMCLCGCAKEVNYTTKYIVNCTSAEFRQEPSNAATILNYLMYGEIVSFEKDVENGYSKVIHNGVTGYVLSTFLADYKPSENASVTHESSAPKQSNESSNDYGYLISNQNENSIEEYISTFVRPLYNQTNDNIDMYSKSTSGSATIWSDSMGLVKKELSLGAENYNMSREYYYDSSSGKMVFAFIYKGSEEYRLYFKDNKLVRYIDDAGNIVNNPASTEALKMASYAINEAY